MRYHYFHRCLALVLFLTIADAASTSENKTSEAAEELQLVYLGAADGKEFFLDTNEGQLKTWNEAGAFCSSNNLKLASIQTRRQTDVVMNGIRNIGFVDVAAAHVWTAGRYHPPPTDFVWDDTNSQVDGNALGSWTGKTSDPTYLLCIRFWVTRSSFHYVSDECSKSFLVLCST